MKRLIYILLLPLLWTACSNDPKEDPEQPDEDITTNISWEEAVKKYPVLGDLPGFEAPIAEYRKTADTVSLSYKNADPLDASFYKSDLYLKGFKTFDPHALPETRAGKDDFSLTTYRMLVNDTYLFVQIVFCENAVYNFVIRVWTGPMPEPMPSMVIRTAADFRAFADSVNAGRNFYRQLVTLESDIDLAGIPMGPIGPGIRYHTPGATSNDHFAGIFDGRGHTISGVNISGNSQYTGLFGLFYGLIRNLHVRGSVSGNSNDDQTYTGGIVGRTTRGGFDYWKMTMFGLQQLGGQSEGRILNCSFEGDVRYAGSGGCHKLGGIVGEYWGFLDETTSLVDSCRFSGKVTYERGSDWGGYVGGIVGSAGDGTMSNCRNEGAVSYLTTPKKSSNAYSGGIAGYNHGTIQHCTNTGTVSSSPLSGTTGGITGGSQWILLACHNTGTITGTYGAIGGITGSNSSSLRACRNSGTITVRAEYAQIGGIAGYNSNGWGTIYHHQKKFVANYNTGTINLTPVGTDYDLDTGGVVGDNAEGACIHACYSIGTLNAIGSRNPHSYVGGVVGSNVGFIEESGVFACFSNHNGKQIYEPGYSRTADAAQFSSAWVSGYGWKTGDGSGMDNCWKSLGSWNNGSPQYPSLFWE